MCMTLLTSDRAILASYPGGLPRTRENKRGKGEARTRENKRGPRLFSRVQGRPGYEARAIQQSRDGAITTHKIARNSLTQNRNG